MMVLAAAVNSPSLLEGKEISFTPAHDELGDKTCGTSLVFPKQSVLRQPVLQGPHSLLMELLTDTGVGTIITG